MPYHHPHHHPHHHHRRRRRRSCRILGHGAQASLVTRMVDLWLGVNMSRG